MTKKTTKTVFFAFGQPEPRGIFEKHPPLPEPSTTRKKQTPPDEFLEGCIFLLIFLLDPLIPRDKGVG